ncbi:MAG: ribosome-associated translation inhibitor RaiA [Phycisphaeraceae bacterium]|nr:ribosome-associated translation inhibitor RaiA [Phycisphaeraceae bacterium]
MRIDVVGKHLVVTDAIRQYAEQKAEKLLKIFDGTQQIRVLLEETKDRAGDFKAEVVVDVVKHKDFIAQSTNTDLYACIDQAVDRAQRQLRDYKEKLRLH